MNKLGTIGLLSGIALLGGAFATAANLASAQTASTTGTTPGRHAAWGVHKGMGHAPLGNDGNVTAVNGTTITMQEEANEGGGIYTLDASGATFTKNGASATIADIKVGDKIFVQGTVSGTSVTVTQVLDGHPGKMRRHAFGFGNSNPNGNGTPGTITQQ